MYSYFLALGIIFFTNTFLTEVKAETFPVSIQFENVSKAKNHYDSDRFTEIHDVDFSPSDKKQGSFVRIGKQTFVNIVMTIPQLIGPVPVGGNLNVTPFAIGPNGKIFRGEATNIVPADAFIQPLNPVRIKKPLRGNYVIGYFITLGDTSPLFSLTAIANFSGLVLNNPVGKQQETITFPVQTLFLASLESPIDVLTISANFPMAHALVK